MWKSFVRFWIPCLYSLIVFAVVISLSCTNDNGPTAPNVIPDPDPVPVESSDLFIGYESSYYLAEGDSVDYIVSAGYYTNMDSVSKSLPVIGLVLYDENLEIFGTYFGSFYEGMGYNNIPFVERKNGIIGPYSGLWEWVGVPAVDIDTLAFSVYPLPFALYGDISIDEVKERIERYFSSVVVAKALGKRQAIKEMAIIGGKANSTVF